MWCWNKVKRFPNDFHSWLRHWLKYLANRFTRDQKKSSFTLIHTLCYVSYVYTVYIMFRYKQWDVSMILYRVFVLSCVWWILLNRGSTMVWSFYTSLSDGNDSSWIMIITDIIGMSLSFLSKHRFGFSETRYVGMFLHLLLAYWMEHVA